MHKTRIDLAAKTREKVCELLNQRLADLIDLRLQAKQAHWNVKGPNFIALHKLFDEIVDAVDEDVDETAERITALGGLAEGTIPVIQKRTTVPAYDLKLVNGKDHVDALATAIAAVGKAVRESIDQADELGDADTADLFTGTSRKLDQYLWFLEAHLQGDA